MIQYKYDTRTFSTTETRDIIKASGSPYDVNSTMPSLIPYRRNLGSTIIKDLRRLYTDIKKDCWIISESTRHDEMNKSKSGS